MDLEFTVDTDHRKRRRNRTTQSCLNCHTSKRKCDRKRPCQRCIQLGLTGLCVYEIDDPALRDDPTLDETTRLRNRIAELESLVRELRGKPHPRWAETTFRDGDPNEKWHSRAAKCLPGGKRRALSPELVQDSNNTSHPATNGRSSVLSTLLSPIKTETGSDPSSQLYRFSPSPAPSMRYHTFQADVRNPPVEGNGGQRSPAYRSPTSAGSYQSSVAPTSSSPYGGTSGHTGSAHGSSYSDGGSSTGAATYPLSGSDDGRPYSDHYSARDSPPHSNSYCLCRNNAAVNHSYMALSQQLQSTLHTVRQYNHHSANTRCMVYRCIADLNSVLGTRGNDTTDCTAPAYDSNTPTDSEILTPASSSSGPTSFHAGSSPSGGVSPHEWPSMSPTTYNPYFPIPAGAGESHHSMYTHVMS
ncbi:hypothetical protein E1B28_011978 [Marasmius oreades]|nr:uncharacterized protein E1B28_011978 [Marasmius oreades]KAG7087932.1 hypothetical protein E1B28_011978 [Marasmius oreades]